MNGLQDSCRCESQMVEEEEEREAGKNNKRLLGTGRMERDTEPWSVRLSLPTTHSMSNSEVSCPVCEKKYSSRFINAHIDTCLNSSSKPNSSSSTAFQVKSAKRPVESAASSQENKRFKSSQALQDAKPLAERCRPISLDDFVGQEHILGPGQLLRALIEKDSLGSIVLWVCRALLAWSASLIDVVRQGPPGTG